jgi:hypothetical protein
MTFKFEILIFGQQMKMNINKYLFIYFIIMDEFHQMIYLFIYFIIMDEFHQMIYLFNPTQMKFIHMNSFIYGHIHPCRWIKITLNFNLQVHALCSCTSHPCGI